MRSRRSLFGALTLGSAVVLWLHNVSAGASAEDQLFSYRILAEAGYASERKGFGDLSQFEDQIKAILSVQDAVIKLAKEDAEIPFDHEREPKDVYELRRGLCYDRSRAIEKLLATLGFEVRHVAVYATGGIGVVPALLTPGNASHALTEVKTAKGWLAVDPNVRWVALTSAREPLTVGAIRGRDRTSTQWAAEVSAAPHPIFNGSYTYIRGLYSRHGRFYPPYGPIPDVNLWQLLQNFTS